MRQALALKKPKKFKPASALFVEYSTFHLKSLPHILQQVFLPHPSPPLAKGRELNSPQVRLLVQIPDFSKDTVGELTDGSDPTPTPPLRGYALPTSFLTGERSLINSLRVEVESVGVSGVIAR